MSARFSLVCGSLVGAVVVHLVLVACGSSSGSGTGVAVAQSTCQQWQYATWADTTPGAASTTAPRAVPPGWEPAGFAFAFGSGTPTVALKRCAQ